MQCKRCILDDRYPAIKFNEDGICSECLNFDRTWGKHAKDPDFLKQATNKLESILYAAKEAGGEYDCTVNTCGGIDSLYVLYLIKTRYKMNPLVITVDNGFINPRAKENLKKVVGRLGVKHVYYNAGDLKPLYRQFLMTTGIFCHLCFYLIAFHSVRIALENGTPLLVTGMSKRFDVFLPYGIEPFRLMHVMNAGKDTFSEYPWLKKRALISLFKYLLKSRVVYLPDYVSWDKRGNESFLEKEFDITLGGEHYDCYMHDFAAYLSRKKYGFSGDTLNCCQMIRNGELDREEAVKLAAIEESKTPENMEQILDYFKLGEREIDDCIERSRILDSRLTPRAGQFLRKIYFRSQLF